MIVSSIKNAVEQIPMNPRMERAFQFLQTTNLENLPDGRIEIDKNKIFAIVQTYQTKPIQVPLELEGHKKYIDIQCVISGTEIVGWVGASNVLVTTAYDEKTDAWLGNIPLERLNMIRLAAREIAIFYPTDAHIPQLADGKPAQVKKVVVKIAVQDEG